MRPRHSPLVVVALAALGLPGCDLAKANRLVNETNALVEKAGASFTKGQNAVIAGLAKVATDPDGAAADAKDCTDALAEAQPKYVEASNNFKQASTLKVTKEYAEYLTLFSQAMQKRAERVDVGKAICAGLVEKSKTAAELAPLTEEADKLEKEAMDLQAQAQKITTDNPTKFQTNE